MDRIPCADCGCAAVVEWTDRGAVITEPGLEGVAYGCRQPECACHLTPHEGCRIRPPWVCHEAECPRSVVAITAP